MLLRHIRGQRLAILFRTQAYDRGRGVTGGRISAISKRCFKSLAQVYTPPPKDFIRKGIEILEVDLRLKVG
jgi:hypothetical protein